MFRYRFIAALAAISPVVLVAAPAHAGTANDSETPTAWNATDWYNLHGQSTFVYQYHPAFTAPFSGAHSLNPGGMGRETFDATLFAGIRPWQGVEFYLNPEIDQGFGLSNTLGVAGFPSGEAYKVGRRQPYYETQRAFGRFTIGLSGPEEKVDDGPNQIAGTRQANNLIITAGKLSATDIFDTNRYAHDPRGDFLNWSIVDSGAYDYAANAWGYTYGGAIEWNQNWWTLRVGYFTLSKVPNEVDLDPSFKQFELVTEVEERHTLFDHPGKVKLLFFNNRGRMANYNDAVRLAQQTGTTPDVSLVRHYSSRPGAAINAEQEFTDDLGGFLRASLNDGQKEAYEFTEINRSVVVGLALAGKRWSRPDDTFGLAGVINDISKDARNYLAAGGLGILIGDGALPKAGFEKILELYYKAAIVDGFNASVDFQHIENPAYNAVRGPVEVIGFRLHAEF
jgi:high affinity Mn2+ porin